MKNTVGISHPFTSPRRKGYPKTPRHTETLVETEFVSIYELTDGNHSLYLHEFASDGDRLDVIDGAWTWTLASTNLNQVAEECLVHLYTLAARTKPLLASPDDYARARGTKRAHALHAAIVEVSHLVGDVLTGDAEEHALAEIQRSEQNRLEGLGE